MAPKEPKNPVKEIHRAWFQEALDHWRGKLGLTNWRVQLSAQASPDAMADCSTKVEDRLVVVRLGKDFGPHAVTKRELYSTALHELLHVFLVDYREANRVYKKMTDTALAGAEHAVIHPLEELIMAGWQE